MDILFNYSEKINKNKFVKFICWASISFLGI